MENRDKTKTREQLLKELEKANKRVAELEKFENESKQAEVALKESEEKYRTLVEYSSDLIFQIDNNGIVLSVNQAAAGVLGRKPKEISGKNISELFPEEINKSYKRDLKKVFETGEESIKEGTIPVGEHTMWISTSLNPKRDSAGKIMWVFGVSRDITERKRAEEALEESNENFRQVVSSITTIIWKAEVGKNGAFENTYISPVVDELLELPPGTIKNDWEIFFSYIKPEYLEQVNNAFREAIKSPGKVINCEYEVLKENGRTAWFHSKGRIFRKNEKLYVFGSTNDITERKVAEVALQESEKKYRDLFEKSEDASLVIHNGKFIDCNQATINMLGYNSKDELLMMHPSELSPEKQADGKLSFTKANEMMKIAFRNGSHRFEWIHKRFNGDGFPVEVLLTAISTDEENQIIHAVLRDITKRNQTEELLQKSEEKYRLLADNSMDAIWQMDKKLVFTYISPSVNNILGYTVDEWVGTRLSQHTSTKEFFKMSRKALYAIKNFKKFKHLTFEAVMLKKDGNEVPIEITGRLLLNKKGLPIGLQGTTRDITERKKADKELKKHRQHLEETVKQRTGEIENKSKKLEESQNALTFLLEDVNDARFELEKTNLQLQIANKEMESFTYSVSHDLRAPLRAILGFSNKFTEIYGGKVDEEGTRLLNVINANTKKMGMLIDDLLAFSRMGRSDMRKVKVDIKGLAHETWNEQKDQYAGRNIKLTIKDMPVAKGDRNMLRQVLFNLLYNAAKFSKYKEVSIIEVGAKTRDSETIYYVKDNGAGFDMRYKDKLFQVFQRLHSDREFEGTGVGLAIVKKVIDMHGGKVRAESEPDKETTIYFSLPIA